MARRGDAEYGSPSKTCLLTDGIVATGNDTLS
jgi:hypothetical protein